MSSAKQARARTPCRRLYLELGPMATGDAAQEMPGARPEAGSLADARGRPCGRSQVVERAVQKTIRAAGEHRLRQDPVEGERFGILALAILPRQPTQQPHAHVILGKFGRIHIGLLGSGGAHVPVDHERYRPSGRTLLHRGQLSPRQRVVEEAGDLRSREAKQRSPQDDPAAVQEMCSQVEPRIGPEGHGDVQVARAALQEQLDRLDRAGRQQPHLVQYEQARVTVQLYRTGQHSQLLGARR